MIRALQIAAYDLGLTEYPSIVMMGLPRSPGWSKLRNEFIAANPQCAACGRTKNVTAHHRKPYHIFPELELEASNLIQLCESGPGGTNCHALVGHCGNWSAYNPNVEPDAAHVLAMIEGRLYQ